MGIYLNPGNSGFEEIRRSPYVDKTGLITLINHTIGTKKKLTCISRPRRFGKSYAAQMLCAYYDRTCSSEKLFSDCCIAQDDAGIQKIHSEKTAPLHYNREDSLRSVIKLAYYTYRDHYLQPEELPAGDGYADIVYRPRPDSDWPALVIELKWNQTADGAIDQILRKDYPAPLRGYGRDILLVGINYDKNAPAGERKHTCRIVKV